MDRQEEKKRSRGERARFAKPSHPRSLSRHPDDHIHQLLTSVQPLLALARRPRHFHLEGRTCTRNAVTAVYKFWGLYRFMLWIKAFPALRRGHFRCRYCRALEHIIFRCGPLCSPSQFPNAGVCSKTCTLN